MSSYAASDIVYFLTLGFFTLSTLHHTSKLPTQQRLAESPPAVYLATAVCALQIALALGSSQ